MSYMGEGGGGGSQRGFGRWKRGGGRKGGLDGVRGGGRGKGFLDGWGGGGGRGVALFMMRWDGLVGEAYWPRHV